MIISGCGFLGEAAADLFYGDGWEVLGLCATPESATRLSGKPYEVRALDIRKPFTIEAKWFGADDVIHCASTGRGGVEDYHAVYLQGLLNLIAGITPRRVLFTGSTSVYAQTDGTWVDENSEATPQRDTGRVLLEAEAVALASGGFVARLSGLYGPGRSVLLRKFLSGDATLEAGGERWINQVHRDDAARAIVHLLKSRVTPGIYNISDDTPSTQRDVYAWIAEYFGKPLPPAGEADLGRKRGWTSKRVGNSKMRATGWQPKYPSYREALPSLL